MFGVGVELLSIIEKALEEDDVLGMAGFRELRNGTER